MNELEMAIHEGAKAFPDRRHDSKRYWFRLGKFDIWSNDYARKVSGHDVWVVAIRQQVNGKDCWPGPVRFGSLESAFEAIRTGDWSKAEHQQGHVRHPTECRKLLVNLRVSEAEYYRLKKLAGKKSLSEFVRSQCLE